MPIAPKVRFSLKEVKIIPDLILPNRYSEK